MTDAAAAQQKIRRWRHDPCAFARENFGVTLDPWQEQALAALKPEGVNRLAMKACAGPGKSAVLAWIGWWMLACFAEKSGNGFEHPKGAAVSITGDNLRDNLWPELAKWRNRSAYLQHAFEWQKERIFAKQHPETWFLSARSFAKAANADELGRTLSGLHSRFPFVLLDESGDMPPQLGRTAEQAMGGVRCGTIAQAGNTTSMTGLLYESAVSGAARWHVVSITADPDDPNRTTRVDAKEARAQIEAYGGRSNPWVMSFILGQFPPGGFNALLTLEEVETAMKRVIRPQDIEGLAKLLGLDCARFGDDRTVLFPRQGRQAFKPAVMRNATTTQISARTAKAVADWGADAVFVDGGGGYGAGPIDQMRQANIAAFEIMGSSKPNDPRYFNKRTEMWFDMAQWVKSGGSLPDLPELKRELTLPTYYFQDGKFRLEEKDQIKKRMGFSPDLADGLGETFAFPVAPRAQGRNRAIVDRDEDGFTVPRTGGAFRAVVEED